MHTIYRIERAHNGHKIGQGAYRYRSDFRTHILNSHNDSLHPSLYQDFDNDMINSSYYCACPTLDKLNEWFNYEIKLAYACGLVVAEYEVNRFVIGASRVQCVFQKESIINKRYLELGDVLK